MTQTNAIEAHGLIHRYGNRTAITGLALAVRSGEIVALLGPNGGGKSTLFRILATLLTPTAGEARVLGFEVRGQPQEVRRRIGVLFQSPSLDRKLTVVENLRHQGHLYGLRGRALAERIETVLEEVRLADRRNERVEKLSGGQLRRVEIAKSLVHSPAILLLDEPSTGLDPAARRTLREQLESLRQKNGVTCLLTTHLMEEADTCDRVAILDQGKLVAVDTPRALKEAIQGDVITITTDRCRELHDEIRSKFQVEGTPVGDAIRLEHVRGHEFAAKLADAFGDRIDAVSVTRPTLDDVFFKLTGRQLSGQRQGEVESSEHGEGPEEPDSPSPCLPVSLSPCLAKAPGRSGSTFALPAASLAWREVVRFLRQPSRVLGGLATPILFWILLGSGLGRSFKPATATGPEGYLAYAFTGTAVMIVLFTSIFSTISIIQDRAEGFLQSVLASPAPRSSIVAGKVAGATLLAMGQAALFVLLAPTIGLPLTAAKAGAILGSLLLVSMGLSGLGFVVAWSMNSTQGFHSIMNLVLMPMWILSGALFPASGAPLWLRIVMAANPLTYGVALLRHVLEGGARTDEAIPAVGLSLILTAAFTLAMMTVSTWLACRPAKG